MRFHYLITALTLSLMGVTLAVSAEARTLSGDEPRGLVEGENGADEDQTTHHVVVRLGGLVPLFDSYGGTDLGFGGDVAVAVAHNQALFEPRAGIRGKLPDGPANTGGYREHLFDLTGAWLISHGGITPLVGAGAGLRYLSVGKLEVIRDGQSFEYLQERNDRQSGWGFGGLARTGLLMGRDADVQVSAVADYNLSTVAIDEQTLQHGFSFALGVHF